MKEEDGSKVPDMLRMASKGLWHMALGEGVGSRKSAYDTPVRTFSRVI